MPIQLGRTREGETFNFHNRGCVEFFPTTSTYISTMGIARREQGAHHNIERNPFNPSTRVDSVREPPDAVKSEVTDAAHSVLNPEDEKFDLPPLRTALRIKVLVNRLPALEYLYDPALW